MERYKKSFIVKEQKKETNEMTHKRMKKTIDSWAA